MDGEKHRQSVDGEKHSQLHNLEEKTLPQLMELLERQEQLISKQKAVLNRLPDKGQKVKNFTQTLRQVISERQRRATNEGAVRLSSAAGPSSDQQTNHQTTSLQQALQGQSSATEMADLQQPQQTSDSPILGDGEMTNTDSGTTASLSECLEQLTVSELASPRMSGGEKVVVHTDRGHLETRYTNSYENVMKRHEGETKRKPFKPHSSLKISNIQELPENYKLKSKGNKDTEKVTSRPVHSSSQKDKDPKAPMPVPVYKLGSAKEISIQDSVQLQEKQRDELEKQKSIHAAERLAERLNIKTVVYQPETVDMDYRNSDAANDANVYDSDDVSDDELETLD